MSKEIFPKIIFSLLILSLILPLFSFSQEGLPIEAPGTIEGAKEMVEKGGQKILETTPGVIKKIWREEVLSIWRKMWDWFKGIWKNNIQPFFSNLWYSTLKPRIQSLLQKIRELIGREAEERKPLIEERFEKEKEEMKEEIPKATQSLWERFKELLK